uniref:Uncharacterized protein n=1 Tax=Lepeophtheirus salmonis TaxID=72036 RepID=A0A0K2TTH4_LEPSM
MPRFREEFRNLLKATIIMTCSSFQGRL